MEMKKYKIVAMPTSPVEDKINACLHFLKDHATVACSSLVFDQIHVVPTFMDPII